MRFINTDLTCRLDALPWTGFHTRFVLALGITWILDAFEVVIVSAVLRPMAEDLQFTTWQIINSSDNKFILRVIFLSLLT
jgi:Bll0324 protein